MDDGKNRRDAKSAKYCIRHGQCVLRVDARPESGEHCYDETGEMFVQEMMSMEFRPVLDDMQEIPGGVHGHRQVGGESRPVDDRDTQEYGPENRDIAQGYPVIPAPG
jgi:hypothetical protein